MALSRPLKTRRGPAEEVTRSSESWRQAISIGKKLQGLIGISGSDSDRVTPGGKEVKKIAKRDAHLKNTSKWPTKFGVRRSSGGGGGERKGSNAPGHCCEAKGAVIVNNRFQKGGGGDKMGERKHR